MKQLEIKKSLIMTAKRMFFLVICLYAWIFASAQGVTIDGVKYYLYSDTHEAVVACENAYEGELVIPSEVNYEDQTYTVKSISCMAFCNNTSLTKVRIPKTVENISPFYFNQKGAVYRYPDDVTNPFMQCTSLESIEVDEENLFLCSVDGILFNKDKTQLFSYPANAKRESYIIPETVTSIGCLAFFICKNLTEVTMPNSVIRIGSSIFSGCSNLKSIKLSESLTYIDAYSFRNCASLDYLEIPANVSGFGEIVFSRSIKTLVIRGKFPNGLREDTFYEMDDEATLYVQRSEIEKFKNVFSGTVLPLDAYTGIDNTSVANASFASNLFDLQGRRLSGQPAKGMYIQNGKKYVK